MTNDVQSEPVRRTPDRTLLVIGGVIVALVLIAIIVVATRGVAPTLDAGTPEGVVQRYVQALEDGDKVKAREFVEPSTDEFCDGYFDASDRGRLTFVDTNVSGDTASVSVEITSTSGSSLFEWTQMSYTEEFQLKKSGDSWKITQAPYQFTVCDSSAL